VTIGMGTGSKAGTARTQVVACATVVEEIRPLLPAGVTYEVLDFGLHLTPQKQQHCREVARLMADWLDSAMRSFPALRPWLKR
jgi:hypothetical protein